jgi:uncharacterized membrane protein
MARLISEKHSSSDSLPGTEFRPRSHEVSRIEAFSDVVFGFSLTLLVVSLEVPRTFTDLLSAMRGFVPFAVCFAVFGIVWWQHHNFFRRYGLDDGITATLNFVLLFVMLFYTYPLKFVFTGIFNEATGHEEIRDATGHMVSWMRPEQAPTLMIIYGLGYATVYLVFVLLYCNALARKDKLDLNLAEIFDTHTSIIESAFLAALGTLCAIGAAVLPVQVAGQVGFIFFLIPVGLTIIGTLRGKARRKVEALVSVS